MSPAQPPFFFFSQIFKKILGCTIECGGWDLNPRTPTRQGPKPCSFDQTWRPPPPTLLRIENTSSSFNIYLTLPSNASKPDSKSFWRVLRGHSQRAGTVSSLFHSTCCLQIETLCLGSLAWWGTALVRRRSRDQSPPEAPLRRSKRPS